PATARGSHPAAAADHGHLSGEVSAPLQLRPRFGCRFRFRGGAHRGPLLGGGLQHDGPALADAADQLLAARRGRALQPRLRDGTVAGKLRTNEAHPARLAVRHEERGEAVDEARPRFPGVASTDSAYGDFRPRLALRAQDLNEDAGWPLDYRRPHRRLARNDGDHAGLDGRVEAVWRRHLAGPRSAREAGPFRLAEHVRAAGMRRLAVRRGATDAGPHDRV